MSRNNTNISGNSRHIIYIIIGIVIQIDGGRMKMTEKDISKQNYAA